MSFQSPVFPFFLALFLVFAYAIKKHGFRLYIITSFSLLFYGLNFPKLCFFLLLSSLVDYICGKKIYEGPSVLRKRLLLGLSIVFNLALLLIFKLKLANNPITTWVYGVHAANYLIPIGISFYTFQSMSYTIDIFRGKLRPADSLIHFLCFTSFFPQLLAGPIVRAKNLLPQLKRPLEIRPENMLTGIFIILCGLVLKQCISDNLAGGLKTALERKVLVKNSLYWWLWGIKSYLKIYCDFAGYSLVALGISKIINISLPLNFNLPHISSSISEFWKRWHISLTEWFRDYVFLQILKTSGEDRGYKIVFAVFLTFILSALWHGVELTFLLWGLFHGFLFLIESKAKKITPKIPWIIKWIFTQALVVYSMIIFFSPDIQKLKTITKMLFVGNPYESSVNISTLEGSLLMTFLVSAFFFKLWEKKWGRFDIQKVNPTLMYFLIIALIPVLIIFRGQESTFVYFNF